MPPLSVLISGAGIAGPILALLLSRSNPEHRITIVERSPTIRTTGQQVDLRLSGITIMQKLGLLDALKGMTTEESGIAFVDQQNNVMGAFPVEKGAEAQSFSSEYEILRGKFAELLYDQTKDLPNVKYIFGDVISTKLEVEDNILVGFSNGAPSDSYDLLVAADGMRSWLRESAWSSAWGASKVKEPAHLDSRSQFMAYFSMPISDSDLTTTTEGMARWCSVPKRRCVFLRPDMRGRKRCSAYLGIIAYADSKSKAERMTRERLDAAVSAHRDVHAQKALFRDLFADAGWEIERVLAGMDNSEDFYFEEIAQVKLHPDADPPHLSWSRGRTVCIGDAGYCPTPASGMGTTLAAVGAYVLAGELAKATSKKAERQLNVNDAVLTALAEYERILQPYVQKAQKIPPGAPWIVSPETEWGVWILNNINWAVSKSGLVKVLQKVATSTSKETFQLPEYPELNL